MLPKGLKKMIILAFQRFVNLNAEEQWTGLAKAKINLFTKGVGRPGV